MQYANSLRRVRMGGIASWFSMALGILMMAFAGGCGGRASTSVMTPATHPTTLGDASLIVYSNPDKGFETKYTKGWKSGPGDATLTLVPADAPAGSNRSVSIDAPWVPPHLPGMVTIGRVDKGYIDDLKKRMQDVTIDSDVAMDLSGARAHRIKAHATEGGLPMKIDGVVAIDHEQVYILSSENDAGGAAAGDKALEAIVSNWKWKK